MGSHQPSTGNPKKPQLGNGHFPRYRFLEMASHAERLRAGILEAVRHGVMQSASTVARIAKKHRKAEGWAIIGGFAIAGLCNLLPLAALGVPISVIEASLAAKITDAGWDAIASAIFDWGKEATGRWKDPSEMNESTFEKLISDLEEKIHRHDVEVVTALLELTRRTQSISVALESLKNHEDHQFLVNELRLLQQQSLGQDCSSELFWLPPEQCLNLHETLRIALDTKVQSVPPFTGGYDQVLYSNSPISAPLTEAMQLLQVLKEQHQEQLAQLRDIYQAIHSIPPCKYKDSGVFGGTPKPNSPSDLNPKNNKGGEGASNKAVISIADQEVRKKTQQCKPTEVDNTPKSIKNGLDFGCDPSNGVADIIGLPDTYTQESLTLNNAEGLSANPTVQKNGVTYSPPFRTYPELLFIEPVTDKPKDLYVQVLEVLKESEQRKLMVSGVEKYFQNPTRVSDIDFSIVSKDKPEGVGSARDYINSVETNPDILDGKCKPGCEEPMVGRVFEGVNNKKQAFSPDPNIHKQLVSPTIASRPPRQLPTFNVQANDPNAVEVAVKLQTPQIQENTTIDNMYFAREKALIKQHLSAFNSGSWEVANTEITSEEKGRVSKLYNPLVKKSPPPASGTEQLQSFVNGRKAAHLFPAESELASGGVTGYLRQSESPKVEFTQESAGKDMVVLNKTPPSQVKK